MVSAVFHTPLAPEARRGDAEIAEAASSEFIAEATSAPVRARRRIDLRAVLLAVLPPLFGVALLVAVWGLLTMKDSRFPTPLQTFESAVELFTDPLHPTGSNQPGIGLSLLLSLERVGAGFGLAALVGVPLGFLFGRSTFLHRMVSPLVLLLRPVSPLAWLPIGLLAFRAGNPAAIGTVFICAVWPLLAHTTRGVQRVRGVYLDVARVLDLSELKFITRILFPAVLPDVLKGARRSASIAWLVIVAAEMLTGDAGIGSWIRHEWHVLNVRHILVAIFAIGVVGLLLEQALALFMRRVSYDE